MSKNTTRNTREKRLEKRERSGIAKIKKVVKKQKLMMQDLIKHSEETLINNYKTRTVPASDPLDAKLLDHYAEMFHSDDVNLATRNALASVPASWLAENRDYLKSIDHAYSHILDICPRATYQAHSGRCWLFAALNTMRYILIEKFNLNDQFELSEAFLFFYDKIERCHFFLEKMLEFRDKPVHDVVVNGMLTEFKPTTDGGTWTFFSNLILKYGIVPKGCYGETFNTSCTDEMNEIIYNKVSQFVIEIRESKLADVTLQRKIKEEYMPELYTLVSKFMGEPPKEFTWSYHEKGNTFESVRERGQYRSIPNLTPQSFYQMFLEPDIKIANKIVLRHDPRPTSDYYKTYMVEHFGHMVGGKPDVSLNVPWEVLSKAAAQSVVDGKAVWFGADVCKSFDPNRGLLATEGYDYDSVLNTHIGLTKVEGLNSYDSGPTHAMALVGVDLADGDVNQPKKWKVENSWGEDYSVDPGYLLMTNEWFKKYGYEVVIDIDVLDDETRQAYLENEFSPISLPYNDPFGAVAKRHITRTQVAKPSLRT